MRISDETREMCAGTKDLGERGKCAMSWCTFLALERCFCRCDDLLTVLDNWVLEYSKNSFFFALNDSPKTLSTKIGPRFYVA